MPTRPDPPVSTPLPPPVDLPFLPPYSVPAAPQPLPAPQRLWDDPALAAALGLDADWWASDSATAVLAGAQAWPGQAPAQASVYAGHQFGSYTALLGDGRVHTVASLRAADGSVQRLQLKGSGATPYARGADGRATLRASVRELLACVALPALGIPATRALALLGTPLRVVRDGAPEPAGLLLRAAPSFLRYGHLQYHAAQGLDALRPLADWVATQLYAEAADGAGGADSAPAQRHARWLGALARRQAELSARWQVQGFAHGVMNTDNASLIGLTLDFGPYGFMERFRPWWVPNAADRDGRYAWQAQPAVARWNLERLLEACTPLLPEPAAARAVLAAYDATLPVALLSGWCQRLGLARPQPGDGALAQRWLQWLQAARADFHASFRALADDRSGALFAHLQQAAAAGVLRAAQLPPLRQQLDVWLHDWRARVGGQGERETLWRQRLQQANPRVVLRNHLAQRATDALLAGDDTPLRRLLAALQRPFDDDPGCADLAAPPAADERVDDVGCSA